MGEPYFKTICMKIIITLSKKYLIYSHVTNTEYAALTYQVFTVFLWCSKTHAKEAKLDV